MLDLTNSRSWRDMLVILLYKLLLYSKLEKKPFEKLTFFFCEWIVPHCFVSLDSPASDRLACHNRDGQVRV